MSKLRVDASPVRSRVDLRAGLPRKRESELVDLVAKVIVAPSLRTAAGWHPSS